MILYQILVANKYAKTDYTYALNYPDSGDFFHNDSSDSNFDLSDSEIDFGKIVEVEFGKTRCLGVCIGKTRTHDNTTTTTNLSEKTKIKIKPILRVFEKKFEKNFIEFIKKMAEYNLISIGSVLELVFASNYIKEDPLPLFFEQDAFVVGLEKFLKPGVKRTSLQKLFKHETDLQNPDQKFKIHHFQKKHLLNLSSDQIFAQDQIQSLQDEVLLLEGATGSGKTIVALEGIWNRTGKILIITPEISLAKNWGNLVEKMFGQPPIYYHHKLSDLYKCSVWHWALSNQPGIIIGARSALFLPYKDLSMIIIDEEHSLSLRQEVFPFYHARDMAVLRCFFEKIPCLLMSATPSLETLYNVDIGKYKKVSLSRLPSHGIPEFEIVRREKISILAPKIIEEIESAFKNQQQVLLFLNRKGYTPYNLCSLCWIPLKCRACDVEMVLYKNLQVICHKCQTSEYLPTTCPSCKQNTSWKSFGIGIEKLEEFVKNIFPNHKWKSISSETKEISEYIDEINSKKIDGLIATQVLAQGHDFKNIALVVIVDADMGVNSPDFRSEEKMLQLWNQIRGRSGRHEVPGKLIIQTSDPNNKFISIFAESDPYKLLIEERRKNKWPPFSRCAAIVVKSKNKMLAQDYLSNKIFQDLRSASVFGSDIEFHGPLYIGKFKYLYEWRFLIKVPRKYKINEITQKILDKLPHPRKISLEVEIDPYSFL